MVGEIVVYPHTVDVRKALDRKSTRLNSSHVATAYAVFCLKKAERALLRPRRARRAGALLAARSRAGTDRPPVPRRGREGLPGRHRAVRLRDRLSRSGAHAR